MNRDDIRAMTKIARDAGFEISRMDYDWTVHAYHPKKKTALIIAEVFRPERDGYVGGRLITEQCLREWIKENPLE